MPKCTTRGCRQLATWEIEIRRAGAEYWIYYACDKHCPDPAALSPQDEIRRLVENRKVDNCPRDDVLDAEMRLIVDGGCHPDCQHMSHCVRCGPICKAVHDKLMVENCKVD